MLVYLPTYMEDVFERMKKMMNEMDNKETLFLDPFNEEFFEMFTQKRMEILKTINSFHPGSIRELAKLVDRDIKNVFTDLQTLNNCNIVDFVNEGRSKKPVIKTQTVVFTFKTISKKDDENGQR